IKGVPNSAHSPPGPFACKTTPTALNSATSKSAFCQRKTQTNSPKRMIFFSFQTSLFKLQTSHAYHIVRRARFRSFVKKALCPRFRRHGQLERHAEHAPRRVAGGRGDNRSQ